MPEYLAPGVYLEETSFQPKPIEGVPTGTTGFIGPCHKGPINRATLVTNLAEFQRAYGSDCGSHYTWHAARAFFEEGGRHLYVARTPRWTAGDCRTALRCLEAAEEISIVAAPATRARSGRSSSRIPSRSGPMSGARCRTS